ncbi:hypothetical protein HY251_11360 [bacterium]|nr:hypothetical protein [bacterium]
MRRNLASLALSLVLMLASCHSQGSSGEAKAGTGSLKVTVKAVPKEGVHGPSTYESSGSGPPRLNYSGLDGIVVYVVGTDDHSRGALEKPEVVSLRLGPEAFERTLVPCPRGSVLSIENASASPATIYAVSAFDAGTLAPGSNKEIEPTFSGPAEVLVEERESARATVFAAAGKRVVVLKSKDSYEWKGLAPGTYVAHAWHKRFPEVEASVTVKADETAEVELKLGVNELPKVPR